MKTCFMNAPAFMPSSEKIIVIAIGKYTENENGERGLKTKYFTSHDESVLLNEFKVALEKTDQPQLKLCAHNGKEFDFPYLSRRMLVQGIGVPDVLNISGKKPWDTPHLDTMEMWKFGDYKHYTSLDLLATIFNSTYSLVASALRELLLRGKTLPFIRRYVSGSLFVGLGVLAATATAGASAS